MQLRTDRGNPGVTCLDYAAIGEPPPTPATDDARVLSLFRVVLSTVVLFPLLAGILAAVVAIAII